VINMTNPKVKYVRQEKETVNDPYQDKHTNYASYYKTPHGQASIEWSMTPSKHFWYLTYDGPLQYANEVLRLDRIRMRKKGAKGFHNTRGN